MGHDEQSFEEFMKRRGEVASAYVRGEGTPLAAILTGGPVATFFGPSGGAVQGASQVATLYADGAKHFGPKGSSELEILQHGASDGIGYWVGIQHGQVQLGEGAEPAPMDLRITEVFRREGGSWKLVHRHADTLVTPKAPGR